MPCDLAAIDGGMLATVGIGGATLMWTSKDGRSWSVLDRIDLSCGTAALGNQLLFAGVVLDPESESGVRQVLLHRTVEP